MRCDKIVAISTVRVGAPWRFARVLAANADALPLPRETRRPPFCGAGNLPGPDIGRGARVPGKGMFAWMENVHGPWNAALRNAGGDWDTRALNSIVVVDRDPTVDPYEYPDGGWLPTNHPAEERVRVEAHEAFQQAMVRDARMRVRPQPAAPPGGSPSDAGDVPTAAPIPPEAVQPEERVAAQVMEPPLREVQPTEVRTHLGVDLRQDRGVAPRRALSEPPERSLNWPRHHQDGFNYDVQDEQGRPATLEERRQVWRQRIFQAQIDRAVPAARAPDQIVDVPERWYLMHQENLAREEPDQPTGYRETIPMWAAAPSSSSGDDAESSDDLSLATARGWVDASAGQAVGSWGTAVPASSNDLQMAHDPAQVVDEEVDDCLWRRRRRQQ